MGVSSQNIMTFGVSNARAVFSIIIWSFLSIVLSMFLFEIWSEAASKAIYSTLFFHVIVTLVALVKIIDFLRGRPKLIINDKGLVYKFTFRELFCPWDDVGPFSVGVQRIFFNKFVYICAYKRENYEVLKRHSSLNKAGLFNADIQLLVKDLDDGKNEKRANSLVNHINRYRELYHSPVRNDLYIPNESKKRIIRGKIIMQIASVAVIILMMALYVFAKIYW
ncbi:hypothetical protein [Pseudemcibacter aquimaris]|uniref:hypothetical protein n=1 Tax=Pseudemcibacter aquimaris TaxID=2857064 RepID=UPI002011E78A|nr:hypothetical protein [Pseudemcibacter aquimaris]MCC3860116.1 hypothetical protein [Pseudemcibacter aquimaris]WDU57444.1 hypothetical protein KW060_09565 [Pseudemcibacter aquimaris]